VLYMGDDKSEDSPKLAESLQNDKAFNPIVAFGYMVFILLCFPCIATIVAIKNESGSWKWGIFSAAYSTTIAWIMAFIIFQIGSLWI